MCGIIAIAGRAPTAARLIEGLTRLEYRGYDSAGLAVIDAHGAVHRRRAPGKIAALRALTDADPLDGPAGLAHTRWATHGPPTEANAHPHAAGRVTVVHNGIIENWRALREALQAAGRAFASDTDSEVIAHLIDSLWDAERDPAAAVRAAVAQLEGAFAIAVGFQGRPDLIVAARRGSPLVVGREPGETFLGSDALALAPFTNRVAFLEDGDVVVATPEGFTVTGADGTARERPLQTLSLSPAMVEKGDYRHFMEKEIHEQPDGVARTLSVFVDPVAETVRAPEGVDFARIDRLSIVACGTAAYAAMVARYWFEPLAGLPVDVDIASEFRYRAPALAPGALALAISQSGETADTKAALELCKAAGLRTAALVNVPSSTIARLADVAIPTQAGPEIGVASTKAFTAQLSALAALAVAAARARERIDADEEARLVRALLETPRLVAAALAMEADVRTAAVALSKARDVLYLGRGAFYPLALEAALKLKEISYIHAEGYAAGELKHGPIALVDEATPTVALVPGDALLEKTASSLAEVAARRGPIVAITDAIGADAAAAHAGRVLLAPTADPFVQPIVFAVPVQLLAYHVAVEKGTDVDQPRNLAKSVTVE